MTTYCFYSQNNHFSKFGGSYFAYMLIATDYSFEKFGHERKEVAGNILVRKNL